MLKINRTTQRENKEIPYKVLIDGKKVGEISNGDTIELSVTEGEHEIRLGYLWQKTNPIVFNYEGDTIYFACGTTKDNNTKPWIAQSEADSIEEEILEFNSRKRNWLAENKMLVFGLALLVVGYGTMKVTDWYGEYAASKAAEERRQQVEQELAQAKREAAEAQEAALQELGLSNEDYTNLEQHLALEDWDVPQGYSNAQYLITWAADNYLGATKITSAYLDDGLTISPAKLEAVEDDYANPGLALDALGQISRCRTDYTACNNNEQVVEVHDGYHDAVGACVTEANNQAKYGDPDWSWVRFGIYYQGDSYVNDGLLRIADDEVKFENGFGAMVRSRVECSYNLKSEEVVRLSIDAR